MKQPGTPATATEKRGDKVTWLTNDKARYNKFTYRLGFVTGGKEKWEELKKGTRAEQEAFVEEIEAYPQGMRPPASCTAPGLCRM